MLRIPSWAEMGIEPNSTSIDVLYNRASQCVIALFSRVIDDVAPIQEIYYRHVSNSKYQKVTVDANEALSFENPASCHNAPYVFFNSLRWSKESGGVNWHAVLRLSLPSGQLDTAFDPTMLRLPTEYEAGWIASIIAIDDADRNLILTCRLGLERKTGPQTSEVDYWICDVDLNDGAIRQLARLPYVFA